MALEPVTISVEVGLCEELIDMTRRFWIGVALTLPIVMLKVALSSVSVISHALRLRTQSFD